MSVVRYGMEFVHPKLNLASNCHGFDVDPIAIVITFLRLSSSILTPRVPPGLKGIARNLTVCNPLFAADKDTSLEARYNLYARTRMYAPEMGLPPNMASPPAVYDVILGNPPWEKIRFEEKKHTRMTSHATVDSSVYSHGGAENGSMESDRTDSLFAELREDYRGVRRRIAAHFGQSDMPDGELNTYVLFLLLAKRLMSPRAVTALILKSAIATSPVNSRLFQSLCAEGALRYIHFFENRERIFEIDSREKFCVVLLSTVDLGFIDASFGNVSVQPLGELATHRVNIEDLAAINPETGQFPAVTDSRQFVLLLGLSRATSFFRQEFSHCKFGRLVHLTTHRDLLSRSQTEGSLPVIEGKLFWQHDRRFATFAGVPMGLRYTGKARALPIEESQKSILSPESRYFIREADWERISRGYEEGFMLAWRSLTSSTNRRTMVAVLSPFLPGLQSVQFLQSRRAEDLLFLAGLFNSSAFDQILRLKLPGIDVTQKIVQQMPVPARRILESVEALEGERRTLRAHIEVRVAWLYVQDVDLNEITLNARSTSPELRSKSRLQLLEEIDRLCAQVYSFGLSESQQRELLDRAIRPPQMVH